MEVKLKGIVKKNQIIITSLAILIAVAGYLNYSEKNIKNMSEQSKEAAELVNDSEVPFSGNEEVLKNYDEDTLLTGTDDIMSNDNDVNDNVQANANASLESDVSGEDGNDSFENAENTTGIQEGEESDSSGQNLQDDDIPGTAVFTNIGTFSSNARLSREQLRAKNKETLLEMINGGNLSEEQKAEITQEMLHITDIAELENEIEILLEAKGFAGAVVSIGDENVDVVVNTADVTDAKRAQIEDIVKRKTNLPVSDIVITPITIEN